ncbi:hypothetical protein KAR91_14895 [Candidatus Pacearchaeota archaeon]|nr:hypothetical protein [Candidatus Pacearchaeota archaeon]
MFGSVGAVLGKVFGTDKAVANLLDKNDGLLAKAGGWIGNFNYTDEEKAESDAKTREWGLRQLEALAPFKVVQRILAFAASGFWILVGINVLAAIWIEALYPHIKIKADMMAFAMSDYVFWPVLVVFALYFSGGVLPRGSDKK